MKFNGPSSNLIVRMSIVGQSVPGRLGTLSELPSNAIGAKQAGTMGLKEIPLDHPGPRRIESKSDVARLIGRKTVDFPSLQSFGTRLVEVSYRPLVLDVAPLRVIAQTTVSAGSGGAAESTFVWVDGMDEYDPILLPLSDMSEARDLGTVAAYFDAHSAQVAEVLEATVASGRGGEGGVGMSCSLVVRAVEAMKADGCTATQAVEITARWANLLLELDQMERIAFNEAFGDAARAVIDAETLSVELPPALEGRSS